MLSVAKAFYVFRFQEIWKLYKFYAKISKIMYRRNCQKYEKIKIIKFITF